MEAVVASSRIDVTGSRSLCGMALLAAGANVAARGGRGREPQPGGSTVTNTSPSRSTCRQYGDEYLAELEYMSMVVLAPSTLPAVWAIAGM